MRKRAAGAGFLSTLLILFARFLPAGDSIRQPTFSVASPRDGAVISSAYVALNGTASPDHCVEVTLDGQRPRSTCADSSGHFEMVVPAAQGNHILNVAPAEESASTAITIRTQTDPPVGVPLAAARWDLLREGDIILSHDAHSPQNALYAPVYTHAALYLGAGAGGAAEIAEAVSEESADGLGEVRSVPIEESLAWRTAQKIDLLRVNGGLGPRDRESILRFAKGLVNRELKFWSASDDFGAVYSMWLQWDPQHDRPLNPVRFQKALDGLRARKFSDQRFNCTTLVWRSYWEGSQGQIDLAAPNRMTLGGQFAHAFTPAFLGRVLPDFLTPDSLYRSGKLIPVEPAQ